MPNLRFEIQRKFLSKPLNLTSLLTAVNKFYQLSLLFSVLYLKSVAKIFSLTCVMIAPLSTQPVRTKHPACRLFYTIECRQANCLNSLEKFSPSDKMVG